MSADLNTRGRGERTFIGVEEIHGVEADNSYSVRDYFDRIIATSLENLIRVEWYERLPDAGQSDWMSQAYTKLSSISPGKLKSNVVGTCV